MFHSFQTEMLVISRKFLWNIGQWFHYNSIQYNSSKMIIQTWYFPRISLLWILPCRNRHTSGSSGIRKWKTNHFQRKISEFRMLFLKIHNSRMKISYDWRIDKLTQFWFDSTYSIKSANLDLRTTPHSAVLPKTSAISIKCWYIFLQSHGLRSNQNGVSRRLK